MTRRRRREAGFTMLELLVTLVISVFALMGILALHNSLSDGTTRAGESEEAVAVGAQVIEELRGKRPADLPTAVTGSTASAPFSNATYKTVLGRNGVAYTVGVAVTSPDSGLWRLHVDVSWADDVSGETTTLPLELVRTTMEAL
jgi:type II secretory pathway pseudopilin PulG